MVVVYIASPYTKGDTEFNVQVQLKCADTLMSLGYCPAVPLLRHFQHISYPREYEEWLKIDLEKIKRCDVVLRLPGDSKGADMETAFAKDLEIPVVFSIRELTKTDIKERVFKCFKDKTQ